MRIVHIVATLRHGGAERQVLNLVREGRRRGDETWVVILAGGITEWPDYQEILDNFTYVANFRRRNAPITLFRLQHWLRHIRPDIVQTHLTEAGCYGRIAAWLAGVPVILTTEHGRSTWTNSFMRKWEMIAQYKTAMRIAVSKEIAESRRQLEGIKAEKITVIPNGVDVPSEKAASESRHIFRSEWNIPDNAIVIGYCGRLVKLKNVPQIVMAFAAIAVEAPDWHLVIIGDGKDRPAITAAKQRSNAVAPRIHITGFHPSADRAVSAFDLLVMFSSYEGLPMAMLEAMASGVPVLSSGVGEIPEVLKAGGGETITAGDRVTLEEAMSTLCSDPKRLQTLGSEARANIISNYSIAASYDRHALLYKQLLSGSKST